jgi:magnesium-transporting ATPase (P-type)
MSDERNAAREKSRNNARTFGGIVYTGGTIAATILFMTFVLSAFEPDQYLTRIIMIIASLAVGSSMLAFPVAMHNWIVTKDHRFWGTILYYGEMVLIAVNTVVSFIMLLGMDIPWAKQYEPFSVASIIYTVFAWGTIFLIDPQHKEYADEQDNETDRRKSVEAIKKQFIKTEEGRTLIAQMAAAEIAAEWTVENHLAHKGIKIQSLTPVEGTPFEKKQADVPLVKTDDEKK